MLLEAVSNQIFHSFLIITLIAFLLAVTLSYVATKRGGLKEALKGGEKDKFLTPLAEEINKLPLPPSQRIQTTATIVHLFDQELQTQLNLKSQEISKKFKTIVEEKDKSVQFVEEQYKTVSKKYETLNKDFKRLGTEKKQTEEIVRSMAEGVIMVNEKGEILLMNPAAEKLLGVKRGEKIGQSILSDLKEEQLVTLAQGTEGKEEKEIILNSKNDQTKKVLKASNAVIESEDGETVGFVSVLSDVTKQRELDDLKAQFLANISHDLRTPLHNVQEALRQLSEKVGGDLNSQHEKYVSIALNNIGRLSRLITDLLDLSKMEAKQFSLKLSTFYIDEFICSVIETFQAWAKNKQIVIESRLVGPLEVKADLDRINQVLTNLIGNAMKFTPPGGKITVELKTKEQGDPLASKLIEIGVHDTGPGVAKKDFPRIFQKFVQLNTTQLQGLSGTGLGLTISKEIVELHGGKIWVESEEGKGSRFAFEIPQRKT